MDRIRGYVASRADVPMNGLGDTIHAVHTGTEHVAELRLSDVTALLAKVLFAGNVLADCAKQFRHYETLHKAKGTLEGDEKADINASHARACELTLLSLGVQ